MDSVSTDTIIKILKHCGSDAVLEGDVLKVYPKDQSGPICYVVPPSGQLARRIIIQIGQRCGVKSHLFWNPERLEADQLKKAPPTPLALVSTQKPKRRQ